MTSPLPAYSSLVRWTVQDVINWLIGNKFTSCVKQFREASVDGNKLLNITSSDLRQIDVKQKDSRNILDLVRQVHQPNGRGQGGYNPRTPAQDEDSDSDVGWSSDEFDDVEDEVHAPQQRAKPAGGGRLPPPPPKNNNQLAAGPPKPARRVPPPPTEPEEIQLDDTAPVRTGSEEQYEDPYQSRYPGPNKASNAIVEETYEDPDASVPQRGTPYRPPAAQPKKEPPPARVPAPPRGRAPAPLPAEPQEIYDLADEEEEPPRPPPPRAKAPPPAPPPAPEPEDYEEIEEKHKMISSSNAYSKHTKPHLPPLPATPGETPKEETYEAVDEPPVAIPPRSGLKKTPKKLNPGPPPRAVPPVPAGEEYEEVDEKIEPPKVPPPRVTAHTPKKKMTPPHLPPTPVIPVHIEETYEIPDQPEDQDDNYLDMEENHSTAPPIPSRPALPARNRRAVSVSASDSDSDDENYLEMDEDLPVLTPKPTQSALPTRQRKPSPKPAPEPVEEDYEEPDAPMTRLPATAPCESPKVEKKRSLPTPPVGTPGYNHIVVSPRGIPVMIQNEEQRTPSSTDTTDGGSAENIEAHRFYHGDITRKDAETKLIQFAKNGMYLIRRSLKNQKQPYTLQLYFNKEIFNLPIYRNNSNQYYISHEESKTFPTILNLVNNFKVEKLILKGGQQTILFKSVPKS